MSEKTQRAIAAECERIQELLIQKNEAYGDSAIEPLNVAGTGSALDLIAVRVDDKLSRIKNAGGLAAVLASPDAEDAVLDLIGYLVLARVAASKESERPRVETFLETKLGATEPLEWRVDEACNMWVSRSSRPAR